MAIIKPNNNTISAITALPAAITTGKVLQVVTATYTSSGSTNSTSYAESGLTVNITPSSSSSKVYVSSSIGAYGYISSNGPRNFYIQLKRGSTTIAEKQTQIESGTGARGLNMDTLDGVLIALDSPSSTSEQTYKVGGYLDSAADSSVLQFNSNNGPATITVMEISA